MSNEPYLSVVATTRNDNHGGSLTRRMQIFVNGWIEQCRRHALRSELILVEWNPPADREPLADVLSWPSDTGPCEVRVVTVPAAIHGRFRHAESLPLFQMIAKNVGIRRARAPFVLSTNIDILFSDELMSFLASRRLEKGRLYRIDRHDAMADVPHPAPVGRQLGFCREHVLRLNSREGTFPLDRAPAAPLDGTEVAGIRFGEGFGLERTLAGEVFQAAGSEATLILERPSPRRRVLRMLVESGPNLSRRPLELRVGGESGRPLASLALQSRTRVFLPLPDAPVDALTLRLRIEASGRPRSPHFRISEWGWASLEERRFENVEGADGPEPRAVRVRDIYAAEQQITLLAGWGERRWTPERRLHRRASDGAVFTTSVPGILPGRLVLDVDPAEPDVPVEVQVIADAGACVARQVVRGRERIVIPTPAPVGGERATFRLRVLPVSVGGTAVDDVSEVRVYGLRRVGLGPWLRAVRRRFAPPRVDYLHTNGCGDFTLMHRDHWFRLRGYPEWEAYSMNIDGFTCYAAHSDGLEEIVLREPKRIFHIEHSLGWSPKGERELYRRITSKGITWIAKEQVLEHARRMYREGPIISNTESWGLAGVAFAETSPAPALTGVESDKEQDGDAAGRSVSAGPVASDRRKD